MTLYKVQSYKTSERIISADSRHAAASAYCQEFFPHYPERGEKLMVDVHSRACDVRIQIDPNRARANFMLFIDEVKNPDNYETSHAYRLRAYAAAPAEDKEAARAALEAEQERLLTWGATLGGEAPEGGTREEVCARLANLEVLASLSA